jgi:hypothetical protein
MPLPKAAVRAVVDGQVGRVSEELKSMYLFLGNPSPYYPAVPEIAQQLLEMSAYQPRGVFVSVLLLLLPPLLPLLRCLWAGSPLTAQAVPRPPGTTSGSPHLAGAAAGAAPRL